MKNTSSFQNESTKGWLSLERGLVILGLLLAVGLSFSAYILGAQAKAALGKNNVISVKGLAEKNIQADNAEWTIDLSLIDESEDKTLESLKKLHPIVLQFLKQQGFEAKDSDFSLEDIQPHMVTEYLDDTHSRVVQQGYKGQQSIRIASKDLNKVSKAFAACQSFEREQNHLIGCQSPDYLVSNLEDVKMSLIADATKNAKTRAKEFVKNDDAKVGHMVSARQGAFYILARGAEADDSDYGGSYDKSTIDKTARVVVTIDYAIQ